MVPSAAVGRADPTQADRSAELKGVRSVSASVATCSKRVLASSVRPRTAGGGSGLCQAGSRSPVAKPVDCRTATEYRNLFKEYTRYNVEHSLTHKSDP